MCIEQSSTTAVPETVTVEFKLNELARIGEALDNALAEFGPDPSAIAALGTISQVAEALVAEHGMDSVQARTETLHDTAVAVAALQSGTVGTAA